jgi:hypothetical protein
MRPKEAEIKLAEQLARAQLEYEAVDAWRNLEGRCLQRLEASETPPGAAASDSPPFAIRAKQVFQRSPA